MYCNWTKSVSVNVTKYKISELLKKYNFLDFIYIFAKKMCFLRHLDSLYLHIIIYVLLKNVSIFQMFHTFTAFLRWLRV